MDPQAQQDDQANDPNDQANMPQPGAAGGPAAAGGGAPQQPANVAAVDVLTLKSHFKIPEYSGLAKGTTFTGATGNRTEMLSVQSFIQQVTTIQGAAKWDDEVTAQYVKLSFLPETPVHDWAINNQDEAFMSKWSLLGPTLRKEFATFVSVSDKVEIFRSFKQRPSELSRAYLYRITREYSRFMEDLETMMTKRGADWFNLGPNEEADRKKIVNFVRDFHLSNFFAFGLRTTTLEDVTRSGETDLQEMLKVAIKSEQAHQQSARRPHIAEVTVEPQPSPATASSAEAPTLTEDLIISAIRKFTQKKPSSKSNNPGQSNVSCFYCGIARHKANECRKRAKDRAQGIWRQKIKDTPMSKTDWDKAVRASNPGHATVGTISAGDAEEEYYNFFSKN